MIEFLGRVVGKALYEGILLDYSFSLVFVQKLLGRYSFLDELSTLDPELYRNLVYVKVIPITADKFFSHHIIAFFLNVISRDVLLLVKYDILEIQPQLVFSLDIWPSPN